MNGSRMQLKFHSVLAMPSSPGLPDRTESRSPINEKSDCSSSREQKVEDTPSAELVAAIAEDDAAHQTLSVLDRSANLSFTDLSHLMDEASEQSLGDSTVLAVSSTSKLPQRPAQPSKKNKDNTAVTSRVTRSNKIAPQIVQKPPVGRHKKKSVPTKNLAAIERQADLQILHIPTLGSQFQSVILGQGYSAGPIDKIPYSEETIPLLKAPKCRSGAAGTMNKDDMKPLDEPEPRQLDDSSVEINIPPVDLRPESKKRSTRNVEESRAIHVTDQERPIKRARTDPEKPSHPTLPYQRKYGRNGRTSSPRAESPAIEPNPARVVERPKSRASAMKGKRVGKKTEATPAAPKKGEHECQDVRMDVKSSAPKVPVSLARVDSYPTSLMPVEQESPEIKADRESTTSAKAPTFTQAIATQGHNESKARKHVQMALWEDKNFLQKAEGFLEPVRLPSTKEGVIQKDETSDHDHSITLLVDDDDYKQEKEVVEVKSFLFLFSISDNFFLRSPRHLCQILS